MSRFLFLGDFTAYQGKNSLNIRAMERHLQQPRQEGPGLQPRPARKQSDPPNQQHFCSMAFGMLPSKSL